jgi:hypothetical protein
VNQGRPPIVPLSTYEVELLGLVADGRGNLVSGNDRLLLTAMGWFVMADDLGHLVLTQEGEARLASEAQAIGRST